MIEQVRETLDAQGLLYIGDCKMAAQETRAHLVATHNFYLVPLARVGHVPEELAQWVQAALDDPLLLAPVHDTDRTELGQGYTVEREQTRTTASTPLTWCERVFVVQSTQGLAAAERGLARRLQTAQHALEALTPLPGKGRQVCTDASTLPAACAQIVADRDVAGLLTWQIDPVTTRRSVRAYGGHPARVEEHTYYRLSVTVDAAAVARHKLTLGWRAYVTNVPAKRLSLEKAVQAYRDEYLIERNPHRLKGHALSLRPLWVSRADHAIGLVRLVTIGARLLALAEYQVRRGLVEQKRVLRGLYPGQPKRATDTPTTERLLACFDHVTLMIVQTGQRIVAQVTPLSALQKAILRLLRCPPKLYEDIVVNISV